MFSRVLWTSRLRPGVLDLELVVAIACDGFVETGLFGGEQGSEERNVASFATAKASGKTSAPPFWVLFEVPQRLFPISHFSQVSPGNLHSRNCILQRRILLFPSSPSCPDCCLTRTNTAFKMAGLNPQVYVHNISVPRCRRCLALRALKRVFTDTCAQHDPPHHPGYDAGVQEDPVR